MGNISPTHESTEAAYKSVHKTALDCIAEDCSVLHCTALDWTGLLCSAMHSDILRCTALQCSPMFRKSSAAHPVIMHLGRHTGRSTRSSS
mmetsp:Transcript_27174/g.63627  ORF Transcript_27174/g.63627 Transcript_27174/m.63627 type:complete len:90 (-) Transcript_27174:238-507(-)